MAAILVPFSMFLARGGNAVFLMTLLCIIVIFRVPGEANLTSGGRAFLKANPRPHFFKLCAGFGPENTREIKSPRVSRTCGFSGRQGEAREIDKIPRAREAKFDILASWHQLGCLAAGWVRLGCLAAGWAQGPGPRAQAPGPGPRAKGRARAQGEGPGPRARGRNLDSLASRGHAALLLMAWWRERSPTRSTATRVGGFF